MSRERLSFVGIGIAVVGICLLSAGLGWGQSRCPAGYDEVMVEAADFEGGFPPAGWTVANTTTGCAGIPEWTNTDPGARGNFTGGIGLFAIADSDACGSSSVMNTEMRTPILDFTGLIDPQVAYWTDYNDISSDSDVADLDVSTDGGATWANVVTWNEDHRGPLLVEQLIPGAGQNNVIIRWNYSNATWDWWWEVDDVIVTACAPAQGPSIELTKTVGTVPAVCAATDSITVPAGTEVYYCYQVENTGSVTFELHDLTDDQLGTLLNNFPFTLAPGASSPEVIVPETVNLDAVNTATWTAKTLPFTATAFSFVEISTTGTALNLTDDSEANIISPFPFTLFGVTSSDLRVANNGGILFGVTTGDLSTANAALPNAAVGRTILPFWDDIDSDTGNVFWEVQGAAPNRVLIVEWYNRPHYSNIGSATFEVLLYETSNAIVFQYLDTDFGNATYNAGASATVGLNDTGTNALQYSFNQAVITDGLALLHDPAANLTASSMDSAMVDVLFPNINVDPLGLVSMQLTGQIVSLPLNVGNTGDAPLDWEVLETEPDRPVNPDVQPAPEPVFNVPAAVTSKADCGAFESYPGREPEGYAEFCEHDVAEPGVYYSADSPASTGYALDIGYVSDNFVSFILDNFPGQTVIGAQPTAFYGMDFDPTGTTLYALNDATDQLGTLDLTTGAFAPLVACPPAGGAANWTGLSIDPVTGTFYASTAANLYTIDPATGVSTLVGPFVNATLMIDIAIGSSGAMYGHDISTDSIYSIDTTTGAATLVGPTGYAANFAQGMDFDNEDGTLYIFLYQGSGANVYGTVDLATGAVTPLATSNPLGEFEGATQTLGSCIPSDYAWLNLNPTAGTTPPAGSTMVNVTFDSTGIAVGMYEGQLCVRSNDPDFGPGNGTNLVVVPVTMEVLIPVELMEFSIE